MDWLAGVMPLKHHSKRLYNPTE